MSESPHFFQGLPLDPEQNKKANTKSHGFLQAGRQSSKTAKDEAAATVTGLRLGFLIPLRGNGGDHSKAQRKLNEVSPLASAFGAFGTSWAQPNLVEAL